MLVFKLFPSDCITLYILFIILGQRKPWTPKDSSTIFPGDIAVNIDIDDCCEIFPDKNYENEKALFYVFSMWDLQYQNVQKFIDLAENKHEISAQKNEMHGLMTYNLASNVYNTYGPSK